MNTKLLPLIFCSFFIGTTAWSQSNDFASCIAELSNQAIARGISPSLVDDAIKQLELQTRVLELDRAQPEFTQTFSNYLNRRVNSRSVQQGRKLLKQHKTLLDRLQRQFGVPGRYLIAFWGLETNYGGYLGKMKTLDSLATLACDNRRSDYFSNEFIEALTIAETHRIKASDMKGSWAGAVGHTQFMPSNYNRYAIDGDGDNVINLWQSEVDALSSAAHFLHKLGWQPGQRWGREVLLPKTFNYSLAGLNNPQSLFNWASYGVTQTNNSPITQTLDMDAALVIPAGHKGPTFMIYPNFRTIMKWNRSIFYALAVGHLADRIAGAGGLARPPSRDEEPLARSNIKAFQQQLIDLGYELGQADGVIGPATRKSLQAFQSGAGLIADGYPSAETLLSLGNSTQ